MLNQELVRGLYTYSDGVLFNRIEMSSRSKVGKPCGYETAEGYQRTCIFRRKYFLHHLIWIYHNGDIPEGMLLDHVDGDTTNNRIDNLRLATYSENTMNRPLSSQNKSGFVGVSFRPKYNTWRAAITVNGQFIHIGTFATKKEAIEARLDAERKYGVYSWYTRSRSTL